MAVAVSEPVSDEAISDAIADYLIAHRRDIERYDEAWQEIAEDVRWNVQCNDCTVDEAVRIVLDDVLAGRPWAVWRFGL